MRRIHYLTAAAIAMVMAAAAGFWLRSGLSPEAPARFLPLQLAPAAYSRRDAREWHQRLLRTEDRGMDADREVSDLLAELAMKKPELLSDPDLAATAARMVVSANKRGEDVAGLCLAYRWSPVRLQPMAGPCRQALEHGGGRGDRLLVQEAPEGVVLIASQGGLSRRLAAYLRNPYDPEAVHAVASDLAHAGHASVAARLYDELLQLDAGRAARLQSELAELGGLRHPSHEL